MRPEARQWTFEAPAASIWDRSTGHDALVNSHARSRGASPGRGAVSRRPTSSRRSTSDFRRPSQSRAHSVFAA
jgi:hypothetical protein